MINKLRLRFILISMISVFIVLFATISIINVSNYVVIENEASASLTEILNNENPINNQEMDGPRPGQPDMDRMNRNHYFIVYFDQNGSIIKSDYRTMEFMNEIEGNTLAISIYKDEKTGGKYQDFRYAKQLKIDGATKVVVLDIKERLENFRNFLLLSSTISIGGYLALLGLIIFASYIAFKPSIESYKKQKQFITNASHELKTPLTIISTDLDILEMDNGKNEWSESIRDQIRRLTVMTNQLVTLSKLDENDLKNYPFSTFSINSSIKKAIDYFLPSFEKSEIDFKYELCEDINSNGNEYLFEELIYIFLDNSLKYSGGLSKVSSLVLIKDKKDHFHITFSNTLDEDDEVDVSQVTERFYRSPSNKKKGSGIGLSIAKEIINLHKGKIDIKKDNNTIYFNLYF